MSYKGYYQKQTKSVKSIELHGQISVLPVITTNITVRNRMETID